MTFVSDLEPTARGGISTPSSRFPAPRRTRGGCAATSRLWRTGWAWPITRTRSAISWCASRPRRGKNADVAFDFAADAIVPQRQGDYLTATGTTLGSDNGVGVAAMLAVMEGTSLAHGPLELLFTVDEETPFRRAT